MKRHAAVAFAAVLALCVSSQVAEAYLKLGARLRNQIVSLKWATFPIRYFVTNRDVAGVNAQQFQQTIARAFNTWDTVADVPLSSQFVGFTSASPFDDDSLSVLGFASRPDLDRVLGSTSFTIDTVTGDIVESDIFFNSAFPWSVSASGESGRYDLESIALHEIGHLHGLGHSALGETSVQAAGRRVLSSEAVMFPIAFSAGSIDERTLRADDIAGISDIYGADAFRRRTGSVSGKVTKNGKGVVGAHVIAFNPAAGTMVGGFSLSEDGSFVIAGLQPGAHVIRVEPLDDADIESFFDLTANVDNNFKPAFFNRLVVVPRGGTATNVALTVVPK
jgi:hypothetical protein